MGSRFWGSAFLAVGAIFMVLSILSWPGRNAYPTDVEGRRSADLALRASVVLVDGKGLAGCGGTAVWINRVLTAFHCVRGSESGHLVQSHGSDKSFRARVAWFYNPWDLAVLETDEPLPVRVARLAADAGVGETIYTVGAPDGEKFLVFRGIVSRIAVDRFENCRANDRLGTELHQLMTTDANIFSGNSGGGAFNTAGDLLGVAVRMAVMDQGGCETTRNFSPYVAWGYYVGLDTIRRVPLR